MGFNQSNEICWDKNYQSLVNDSTFWNSLKNTFLFIIGYLPSVMIIGLLVALLLNSKLCLKPVLEGLFLTCSDIMGGGIIGLEMVV